MPQGNLQPVNKMILCIISANSLFNSVSNSYLFEMFLNVNAFSACRLLHEKSFNVFHYPVSEDEAPDYHATIQTPMDVSTLLQHTDSGQYLTRSAFLQDLELIPLNAKV